MKNEILQAVERCIGWIEREMLTYEDGYNGIYERIRIDCHHRTHWVRPDCNAEFARVLGQYALLTGSNAHTALKQKCIEWLLRTQERDPLSLFCGSFPFYVVDGWQRVAGVPDSLYPNDNGKVLVALMDLYRQNGDARLMECADCLARYWTHLQQPDGRFARLDGRTQCLPATPCFVGWLCAGLWMLYTQTKEPAFQAAAEQSTALLVACIGKDGRVQTAYEAAKVEDWRPVSSECAMALLQLSIAYQETARPDLLAAARRVGAFLLSLQQPNGAIANCDETCLDASLQNDAQQCDLVYTGGYALMALLQMYRVSHEAAYLEAAKRYARFLLSIQCKNESPHWDGAWRGSYQFSGCQKLGFKKLRIPHGMSKRKWAQWVVRSKGKKCVFHLHPFFMKGSWAGRCNQNNAIDEGGMYSVYTGWCNTTLMSGLLMLWGEL